MRVDLRYLGRSDVRSAAWGLLVHLAPNLSRQRVFYDAALVRPSRFREGMGALHEVVVGDLRRQPKDRTAWREWKADEERKEAALRSRAAEEARRQELARLSKSPPPPGLPGEFKKAHALYWKARRTWASELMRRDPELFRHLVPCDPVVTVAPDAVFFEAFSKDESSYGCLLVDRDGFREETGSGLGTTNVDYSFALYDSFQSLRSYRSTRLTVDPSGFEVKVEGRPDYREEKIDLPPAWLRGFGQLQAAMALPADRVPVSREALYSVLATLVRRRERTGPRALRFRLVPGRPVELVIDPWGLVVPVHGTAWSGDGPREVKTWGRRRLLVLARLLPLAESIEVTLLGSGLPSIWTVRMGEMRFVLALSGWTANDWTSGTALDLLAGRFRHDAATARTLRAYLETTRTASLPVLERATGVGREAVLGALHRLCLEGQVMYDHAASAYRYRPVLAEPLDEAALGPEPPERTEGLRLHRERAVTIGRDELLGGGRRLVVGTVGTTACEALLDADGAFTRATCSCSFFHRSRLRAGPCRHLLALRLAADDPGRRHRAS